MILAKVLFDKYSPAWMNDDGYNLSYIKLIEDQVRDVIKLKGYLYLNTIYDMLGIGWNPTVNDNLCILHQNTVYFEVYSFKKNEELSYEILIVKE